MPTEFASKAVAKDKNANGWVCYKEFTSGPSGYTGGKYKSGLVLIDDKVGDPASDCHRVTTDSRPRSSTMAGVNCI